MNFHFPAQLTAEDYIEAQRLHVGWKTFLRLSLFMLVVVLGVVIFLGGLTDLTAWIGGAAIWLFWLAIFCWTYPRGIAKRTKKLFAQQKELQLVYSADITDERLIMSAPGRGEWIIPWHESHKWKANDKIVLVYPSDRLFRMFPRRWFSSDAEFLAFKDLLAKMIGPAGKPRKTDPVNS
jgi:hypothetical protein